MSRKHLLIKSVNLLVEVIGHVFLIYLQGSLFFAMYIALQRVQMEEGPGAVAPFFFGASFLVIMMPSDRMLRAFARQIRRWFSARSRKAVPVDE